VAKLLATNLATKRDNYRPST